MALDWTKAVDIEQAAHNLRSEFIGDWYVDPWDWPELAFLLKHRVSLAIEHLDTKDARRVATIDVPKENWGVRPAVLLDILDRLVYQAVVDRLSFDLIGDLPSSVYGWRLPFREPKSGAYARQDFQWDGYRDHLSEASRMLDVGLTTDIVSCFASMPLDGVYSMIGDRCPKNAVSDRLISLLQGLEAVSPRSGLPQRSTASAVLANRLLNVFDLVLNDHAVDLSRLALISKGSVRKLTRRSYIRWMDDMWLFGDDEGDLRKAQYELQVAAQAVGLNLNSAKTHVYGGDELRKVALQIEHSAVDDALKNHNDTAPLEELVDKVLEEGEEASRACVLRFSE